ncbi:MAG: prenyltransferase/squalene oxidase repeat-containing protein [Promethearchaeota archaeon]
MSKTEILDEIKGNISDLHNHFQALENKFTNQAENNLNPAIKLGLNWLVDVQNDDGGFGIQKGKPSIIHFTALALLALSKGGKTLDDPVIQKIIHHLGKLQTNKGWWPYKEGNVSESVGVTGIIIQALDILKINRSDMMFSIALDFLKERLSIKEGSWRDNEKSHFWEIPVNESGLSAIKNYIFKKDKEKIDKFQRKFLEFDSDEGYGWRLDKNYKIDGDIENTAIALKILANLGITRKNDTEFKTVEKAINFIMSSRVKRGFPPKRQLRKRIEEVENDATSLVISGLIAVGYKPYDEVIHNAAQFLSESQNPDGGWGDAPGLESDTDSTAIAIIALVDAGKGAVPLAEAKKFISKTKEFIENFIEKHVSKLDEDLRAAQRLNRLLELNITMLAILLPIIVSFFI